MAKKKTVLRRVNSIKEAKVMIKPEDFENIVPQLGDDDVVKIVDEQDDGSDKSERILDVIEALVDNGFELTVDNVIAGSLFSSGGTFGHEDSELISSTLNMILDDNHSMVENIKPRMKKSALIESVLKTKK